jgi:hypothetical protein
MKPFENHTNAILPVMIEKQPHNPLHGITLKRILDSLVEHYRGFISCHSEDNRPAMIQV